MSGEQITTLAELEALPSNSVILDSMGDPGLVGLEGVTYRESTLLPLYYVATHYLPDRVLYRPDAPSPAEVAEGIAQAIQRSHISINADDDPAGLAARIATEYGQGGAS